MNLTIHRGTKEIGGSCVELRTDSSRILLDFGIPLVSEQKEPFDIKILQGKSVEKLKKLRILPRIKGLYRGEEKEVDAVLISHSHLDHYGFLRYVQPDIPIYMSEGARQLIEISDIFTTHQIGNINAKVLPKMKKVKIGDFDITARLVDHSAFDALAFLVEAEGKRLFYSGDFRGHGRKSILFKRMTENPPKNIDCLLMEGSMLGRDKQIYKDEISVQMAIEGILRNKTNIAFLFASSQNIDRIVSVYKACRRVNSIFVIDVYTAFILYKLNNISKNIPQFNWSNIRVKFFKDHVSKLADSGHRNLLYMFSNRKIELPEIDSKKSRVLMLLRDNSLFPIVVRHIKDIKGATIIYSMWGGYLTEKFKGYCSKNGIEIRQVHTSGHATLEDLKSFSDALKPKILVPIHTFESEEYPRLFKNVKMLKDSEALDL
ncbi:MBL fold metallo-hydrolase [candidate division NPL-UPA2 bacterium]|nr:MBL fold metallo-hydrolase [candidate division NPL-UPA2 bacterium]